METLDAKDNFVALDFIVFSALLVVSAVVGIYYGYKDKKANTTENYFFGGQKMNPIAVGMSMSVTFISAITIIGIPTEAYLVGTVQLWYCFMHILAGIFVAIYIVPMLYRLNVQSVFEFLELRFNKTVRNIFSSSQVLRMYVYLGFVFFLPSLALNAVTPIPLYWSIALTGILCTFYTTLGGMKAVIWTDVIQAAVIIIGCLAVLILAVVSVGGFDEVTAALERGQRHTAFDPDFDITSRKSPLAIFLGWVSTLVGGMSFSQPYFQRMKSCKSVKHAQCAVLSSTIPSVLIALMSAGNGLVMYAYYEGCDLVESGLLQKIDQGMPYMALVVFKNYPGIAGLFIAAIYSGTLSSVSSTLNSFSIIFVQDVLLQKWPNMTDKTKVFAGKISATVFGGLGMALAYIISLVKANSIQVIFSAIGVINGPYIGICFLGAFFPWATTLGSMIGAGFAFAFLIFLLVGSYTSHVGPLVPLPPVDTSACTLNTTSLPATTERSDYTTTAVGTPEYSFEQVLYHITFLYYNILAMFLTITIGLLVSFLTGPRKPAETDPKHFIPILDNPRFPEKVRKFFRCGVPELNEWNTVTVPDEDLEMEMEKFELKNGTDNNENI